MSNRTWFIAAVVFGLASGSIACAQSFPAKPVRLIVPAPPGSSTDVLARLIGKKLIDQWQQPVVIDNRPGAGGTLGTEAAARSAPDGYTLILVNAGFAVSAALYEKLLYDPVKDFAAVGPVAMQPMILVVNPALPAKSVKELIALATSRPNQITFGSNGNGSIAHLVAEMFKWKAGIRMLHVPYKGVSQALTALLVGEIAVLFPGIVPALPQIRSGKIRPLAVSSAKRSAAVPEVPSLREAGVPGYDESNWQGLLAPAGTSPDVIWKVNNEVAAIMQSAAIRKTLAAEGTDAVTGEPSAFGRFLVAETEKWRKLVKASGAKVD